MHLGRVAVIAFCMLTCGCRLLGTTVYTDPVTEIIEVDSAGLSGLEVRTHNGAVRYTGVDPAPQRTTITIVKKGGGPNLEEAARALEALEVFVEPGDGGLYRAGYRWKGERSPRWNAHVSFDMSGPPRLRFDAETHNGPIALGGVQGDVKLVTHNGDVQSQSTGGALYVESHNGTLKLAYAGPSLNAKTHNGGVEADLRECAAVGGAITTHNGRITLIASDRTSAVLEAESHNGGVTTNVSLRDQSVSRNRLTGTIGAGGEVLKLETHNGGIRIQGSTD